MTVLTALARAAAATTGRALPTKTVRHVHLSGRPLVLVAAQLAGEACAPGSAGGSASTHNLPPSQRPGKSRSR